MGYRFISAAAQTVVSKSGHVIAFPAGTATHVPPEAQADCIAAGCVADATELPGDEAVTEAAAIAAAQTAVANAVVTTSHLESDTAGWSAEPQPGIPSGTPI